MVLGKLMKLFNDENRMAALLRNVEVQDSSDVERIAAKLSVSTKTVRNDVKELNCLMGGMQSSAIKKDSISLLYSIRRVMRRFEIRSTNRKNILIPLRQGWRIFSGS